VIGRTAALGAVLAAAAGALGWAAGPAGAGWAALGFGLLATALQTAAVALVARRLDAPWERFSRSWTAGMGLRFLGVVAFGVLVMLDRRTFPPLFSAVGLLGVMVPLLFYEGRLLR
jgi:hypothetical protein